MHRSFPKPLSTRSLSLLTTFMTPRRLRSQPLAEPTPWTTLSLPSSTLFRRWRLSEVAAEVVVVEAKVAVGVAEEVLSRLPLVPSRQPQVVQVVSPDIEVPSIPTFPLVSGQGASYISVGGVRLIFVRNRRPVRGKTFLLQDHQRRIIIIEKSTSSAKTTVIYSKVC